jgi:hypothetical protein
MSSSVSASDKAAKALGLSIPRPCWPSQSKSLSDEPVVRPAIISCWFQRDGGGTLERRTTQCSGPLLASAADRDVRPPRLACGPAG